MIAGPVLIPVDGSGLADRAVPLGGLVAAQYGVDAVLLEVFDEPTVDIVPYHELQQASGRYLESQAEQLRRSHDLAVSLVTRTGAPAAAILDEIDCLRAGAVVMATHGRGFMMGTVLGSVARRVLRSSPAPVFLVPASTSGSDRTALRRIVMPSDGSSRSAVALDLAISLAGRFGAELLLVHVEPGGAAPLASDEGRSQALAHLEQLATRAKQSAIPVRVELRSGNAAREILILCQTESGDAIVLATHGRRGVDRLRHGSVTEELLHHSTVPVIALGPRAGLISSGSKPCPDSSELHGGERSGITPYRVV